MARGLMALVAVVAAFIVSPAIATGAQRFAIPGGSFLASCSELDPCEIHTAVNNASANDEVIIAPGDYGSASAPLSGSVASVQPGVDVHGVDGQPRPRIFIEAASNLAGISLTGAGSKLRHVEIQVQAAGGMGSKQIGLLLDNAQASDVIATSVAAEGRGCVVLHTSRLTDSVCHATQTNAKGVATFTGVGPGTTNNSVLRNVTAIATNTAGRGIEALGSANLGEEQVLTVSNTIARGQPGQADVQVLYPVAPPPPSEVSIILDHSNFGFESYPQAGNDRVLEGPGGGNQRAIGSSFPVNFAGPADFHQLAGSATIDAGATSPDNGPTDFDGDPRTLGSNPDIGADEFVPPPTATTGDPGATTASTAVLNASVNPNLVATTYHFEFGKTDAYGSSTSEADAGAGNAGISATETLTGLDPDTTYHYRIVATSRGGTTAGADRTVTTEPRGGGGSGELQSLGLSPKAFAAAGRGPSVRAAPRGRKPPVGTTVSFKLSDDAAVRFKVERRVRQRGGRVGNRFVPLKGSFGVDGEAGTNRFKFTGRLRGKKLKVGRFRLRGAAGGEVERVKFRIVSR